MNHNKIERGVSLILEGLGVDLKDRNFLETPERVARMYVEMFGVKEVEWNVFPETYTDMIILRKHTMWTLCPHHLLPVKLEVSLAYQPTTEVLGLSKLARIMQELNCRPLLQERFTVDLPRKLMEICPSAKGSACIVTGEHGCTHIRGVRSSGDFITQAAFGTMQEARLFDRFLTLMKGV